MRLCPCHYETYQDNKDIGPEIFPSSKYANEARKVKGGGYIFLLLRTGGVKDSSDLVAAQSSEQGEPVRCHLLCKPPFIL